MSDDRPAAPSAAELALVGAGGLVLALLLTLPAWIADHKVILGTAESEAFSGAWVLWWAQEEILRTGAAPVFAADLNAPIGRALHALPLLDALVSLPFHGVHAATLHNGVAVWELTLAFFGAWLLCRWEGAARWATLPAAVAFACTPALLSTFANGPVESFSIGWVALSLAIVRRALSQGGAPWIVGGVLCLGATFLSNPYHLVFAASAGAPLAILENRGRPWKPWLLRAALIGGGALAMAVPQLMAISMSAALSPRGSDAGLEAELRNTHFVRDLLAFVLPTDRFDRPGVPHRVYLGGVVLLLGLGGHKVARRWLVIAAIGLVFALGDVVSVAGWRLGPNPLTLLLRQVPPYSELSSAFRAGVLVSLALGVAAALGLSRLPRRYQGPAAVLATVLVLLDQLVVSPTQFPLPVSGADIPAFYQDLGAAPAETIVLDFILDEGQLNPSRALIFQTAHRQRLVVDLLPPAPPLDLNPLVRLAQWDPRGPEQAPTRGLCAGVEQLQGLGLHTLVSHTPPDAPFADPRLGLVAQCGHKIERAGAVAVIQLDANR